ncbi:TNF receptor-associated factor 6-B-like isoform X2 [Oscarella lobularis]|uniref:TNF receptor-associated factor 6-B-like isoform X2 n=1 Tax=Oscarella lobularis TaxID=121494 RepID=UPI0033134C83
MSAELVLFPIVVLTHVRGVFDGEAMAVRCGNVGGYTASFVEPLDKELECPICLCLLRDPVQTECGHLFCMVCFDEMARDFQVKGEPLVCPIDKGIVSVDKVFPDVRTRRKLLSTQVLCTNKEYDCSWVGQLKDYDAHIKECDFDKVPCQCDELIARKDMGLHQSKFCVQRKLACGFCGSIEEHRDMRKHLEVCNGVTVSCELCGKEMLRKDMLEHVQGDCPSLHKQKKRHAVFPCQYAAIGCGEKVLPKDMDTHISNAVVYHQKLLFENVLEMRRELQKANKQICSLQKAKLRLQSELSRTRAIPEFHTDTESLPHFPRKSSFTTESRKQSVPSRRKKSIPASPLSDTHSLESSQPPKPPPQATGRLDRP